MLHQRVMVDWRASPDNLSHIRLLQKRHPYLGFIDHGMEQSLVRGKAYFCESFMGKIPIERTCPLPIIATIMVVIDGGNGIVALVFWMNLKRWGQPSP